MRNPIDIRITSTDCSIQNPMNISIILLFTACEILYIYSYYISAYSMRNPINIRITFTAYSMRNPINIRITSTDYSMPNPINIRITFTAISMRIPINMFAILPLTACKIL